MLIMLDGIWNADIGDGEVYPMRLPGTLDESQIGHSDGMSAKLHPDAPLAKEQGADEVISTRYTRKYTFEGLAKLTRRVAFEAPEGKRVFLEAERARCLRLLVNGKEVPEFRKSSISTPHVFEVTNFLKKSEKEQEITFLSDNSYPGLPHDDICYSSAATDETQTNWNGVLGYVRLRVEEQAFLESVRIYPKGDAATIKIDLCASASWSGELAIVSDALCEAVSKTVSVPEGRTEVVFEAVPLRKNAARWDEYEGNLHSLSVCLSGGKIKTVTFGIRDFGADGKGRLALNHRTIFLRGEANCAEFPETGHPPMSVEEWLNILQIYQSYGVNCVRFHSHCPPEAAFAAADRLGMLMQPELSCWNPKDAFESEERFSYYRTELVEILRMLANHPSFVMLTLGNELQALKTGHERMTKLLIMARELDETRLYANGSNVHYGGIGCDENSDFYAAQQYFEKPLRATFANMAGYLNHCYPSAKTDYEETMMELRKVYQKPVFGFEVGQFEVLPDFGELKDFSGVSKPENLKLIQKRVEERGLMPIWEKYVEATGELARLAYREEIEAVLRTEQMSGISLLGLQDFPGQGTALVGMLNSHLKPKPYPFAQPEEFSKFFTDKLPLALLPKYTYENTEILEAEIKIANFGKGEISGDLICTLKGNNFLKEKAEKRVSCPSGSVTKAGTLHFSLEDIKAPSRLELTISIGEISNTYPVWCYPPVSPVCPDGVYETEHFDAEARKVLESGGIVYLTPPSTKEALPQSIQAQFTTDFWSVGTFSGQEGGMGQLIWKEHPIFQSFPTESHTNWQWWPMAIQRAVILPKQYEAIITEMDSYAYLRPMAQLFECRCQKGKLLFSSMGLQSLGQYPEARALLAAIYQYLGSPDFAPRQEIAAEEIERLVL